MFQHEKYIREEGSVAEAGVNRGELAINSLLHTENAIFALMKCTQMLL